MKRDRRRDIRRDTDEGTADHPVVLYHFAVQVVLYRLPCNPTLPFLSLSPSAALYFRRTLSFRRTYLSIVTPSSFGSLTHERKSRKLEE